MEDALLQRAAAIVGPDALAGVIDPRASGAERGLVRERVGFVAGEPRRVVHDQDAEPVLTRVGDHPLEVRSLECAGAGDEVGVLGDDLEVQFRGGARGSPGAAALGVRDLMSAPAAPLAPDLEQALKRLKLRAVRQLAPEVLQTAKVQRWAPEELLRTLVEAEIAARDQANERAPLRVAAFPVRKTLDEFKVQESAVPQPTFAYLASLEWIRGEVAPRTALIRDQLRQRPVACSRPPLQRRSA